MEEVKYFVLIMIALVPARAGGERDSVSCLHFLFGYNHYEYRT